MASGQSALHCRCCGVIVQQCRVQRAVGCQVNAARESKILSMKLARPFGSSSVDGQAWLGVSEAGYFPEFGT